MGSSHGPVVVARLPWGSHRPPAAAIWGGELMIPPSPLRGWLQEDKVASRAECHEHSLRVLPGPTPLPPCFLFPPLSPQRLRLVVCTASITCLYLLPCAIRPPAPSEPLSWSCGLQVQG